MREGTRNPHLYTVLSGWAFRYKLLPDGRRQIRQLRHAGRHDRPAGQRCWVRCSIRFEALSPMLICVFQREELMSLYRDHPPLATTSLDRGHARSRFSTRTCSASSPQRHGAARLPVVLHHRASRRRRPLQWQGRWEIPITQQHLADTLGPLARATPTRPCASWRMKELLRWRDGDARCSTSTG